MVVDDTNVTNIMSGIENTGGVLHNRKKLRQRFDIIKKLGQGTYGKVQLGINKETGQEVAIKTIKKCKIESSADLVRIRREVQIMSSVQHPNIIHIYEVFENREKMVLVMEHAAGGELYDYLSTRKVLPEDEARRVFRQIATAIYYCHKHKICHRDLKLENILLDDKGSAKIADFGLSNVFAESHVLATYCGSPLYASPEIVTGTPYNGPEVDCWSLGVLLYTMVYGAMPFDGTHFKTLVKQISLGDYFEPKKSSPASALIREMLTVCPKRRADIETICSHWWVNEGYDTSCLDIAEELASQTPVRLDLLLSLAPPPKDSDKLVVTEDQGEPAGEEAASNLISRSQSAGSIMDVSIPQDRRITDHVSTGDNSLKPSPTKIITPAAEMIDQTQPMEVCDDIISSEDTKNEIHIISEVEKNTTNNNHVVMNNNLDNSMDVVKEKVDEDMGKGAIKRKSIKKKPFKSNTVDKVIEEEHMDNQEQNIVDNNAKETEYETTTKPKRIVKRKIIKKSSVEKSPEKNIIVMSNNQDDATKPQVTKSTETCANTAIEPKKIIIPGTSVSEQRKEFERRASLNATVPLTLERKSSLQSYKEYVKSNNIDLDINSVGTDHDESTITNSLTAAQSEKPPQNENKSASAETGQNNLQTSFSLEDAKKMLQNSILFINEAKSESGTEVHKLVEKSEDGLTDEQRTKKNAVEFISNAIPRLCKRDKPPMPYGRSSSMGPVTSQSIDPQKASSQRVDPAPVYETTVLLKGPKLKNKEEDDSSKPDRELKLSTLPRRKTSTAEIQLQKPHLNIKVNTNSPLSFRTEIEHKIGDVRSAPIRNQPILLPSRSNRASSLEAEKRGNTQERCIPVQINPENSRPPAYQRTPSISTRSDTLSRQSSLESDAQLPSTPTTPATPSSVGPEAIRKSAREVIIPIAVEGGGYVTPRAGSVEPSESRGRTSRLNKPHRVSSILSDRDSEEDDPFSRLNRHTSSGRDSDGEESRFHLHRLRSSRPTRGVAESTDSVSSGEEDDEDCFEILTAENLFSTLLSRLRTLTHEGLGQQEPSRIGLSSRLLGGTFGGGRAAPFWDHQPFSKNLNERMSSPSWRRNEDSINRFMERAQGDRFATSTLPRSSKSKKYNRDPLDISNAAAFPSTGLDLNDMDLSRLKLSKSDLDVLSCVTPSLSRRIQNQLFSKLPPTQARKLSRTLSMKSNYENGFTKNNTKTCNRSFSVTNAPEDNMTEKVTDGNLLQHNKELPVSNAVSDLVQIAAHNDLYNKLATLSSSQYNARDKFDRSMSTNENNLSENQRRFHGACSVRSTPERSVLGSSFNRSSTMDHVEESKVNHHTLLKSLERLPPKCEVKSPLSDYLNNKSINSKTTSYVRCANLMKTPQRKVSRFLRPDFFDTPRDESVYCKEKRERELETQKVLQEIRCRRERSLDRSIQLSDNNDMNGILCLNAGKQVDHTSYQKTSDEKNPNNITLDSAPAVSLQTNINKNKSNVSNGSDVFEKNLTNNADIFEETESSNSSPKNINVIISDSIPKDTEFVTVNKKTASSPKLNKVSKLIRPKSYAGSKSSLPFVTEKTTTSSLDIAASSNKRDEIEITNKSDNPKTFTKSEEKISDVEKTKILVPEPEIEVKTHEKAKTAKGFFKSIGQKIEKFRNADSNVKSVRKSKNNSDIKSSPNNSVPKQVLEDNKKSKDDLVSIEIPLKDLQPTISSGNNITTNLVVVKPKVESSSKKLVKVKVMNKKLKSSSDLKNGKKENKKNAASDKETLTITNNLIKELDKNCIETSNIINVNSNVNGLDNHITTDRVTATRINEVIHSLKERSLPQDAMGLTESGLIRRAVSVEDMSGHLQPSRRSVSKVLNLFNKKSENNCDAGPKILKRNSEIYESKVAHKSTAIRPNSLIFPNSKVKRLSQQYTKTKSDSALTLPITERVNIGDSQPLSEQLNKGKSVTGCSSVCVNGITFKEGGMPLTLDFSKLPVSKFNVLKKIHADLKISEANNFCDRSSKSVANKNLELDSSSDLSKTTVMPNDDIGSNTALSSCADSELFDNWSVYSDLNTKNTNSLCSPCSEAVSPNFDSRSDMSDQFNYTPRVSSPLSELSSPVCENAESTIDRIHRKSFYPRFNEKKQKRVSEIVGPGAKDYYIKSLLDYKFEDPSQLSKHRHHYSSHHQPNDIRTSLTNMPRSSGFSKSPHDFVDGYKTYSHTPLKEPHNNYLDRTTSFVDPTARSTQLVPGNRCSWLIPKESGVRLGQNNHSGSKDIRAARDTFGWRDYLDRTPSVPISVKRRAKSQSDNKFVASDSSFELPERRSNASNLRSDSKPNKELHSPEPVTN